jgi:hypothetical protein
LGHHLVNQILSNKIGMMTFVNAVHPMFPLVMPQKRLGILEGFPNTVDLTAGGVIFVLVKNSMR